MYNTGKYNLSSKLMGQLARLQVKNLEQMAVHKFQ
jgi:hypothetical protein